MVILNIQQAARFLGKTPAALRNGYHRWGVPHFRLGGQIKFTQEALQDWIGRSMIETHGVAGNGEHAPNPAMSAPSRSGRRSTMKDIARH